MKTQKKEFRFFGTDAIQNKIKSTTILFSIFLFQDTFMYCQSQTYDDFKGNKSLYYDGKTGVLDTNAINDKKKCAKYVRNAKQKFDNIKMNLSGKLSDVDQYATYTGMPAKISMKVYTTAPIGTAVEIQLGKKGKDGYPAGINSQYQAHTTRKNAWEELKFQFALIPKGSETSLTQIDQIILLFNPNSSTSDTYYFTDLTGPSVNSEKSELLALPEKTEKSAAK